MPRSRKATSPQRRHRRCSAADRHTQGNIHLARRSYPPHVETVRAYVPRPHRASCGAATHATDARCSWPTRTGHLGPTVFRSTDSGKTWKEAKTPPAFPKAPEGQKGRVVDHVFWLTPWTSPVSRRLWYAGTSPQGLFRSDDGGATWEPFSYINDDPQYREWMGSVQDGTPDGPKLHSISLTRVIPNICTSPCREVACTNQSMAANLRAHSQWARNGRGVRSQLPSTFHDPHCVRLCPTNPDRLYQQNHCGIYRMDRPSNEWVRIGKNMPKKVGDIGFPMVVHPRDADTAWVFPMDGSTVWPRVSPGGKPAAYVTQNGGKTG